MSVLHIDLNSFFASCEVAASLGKYTNDTKLLVTGDPGMRRGVVLAATYPAKKNGIYAGMPIGEALSRCPDAVCVKANFRLYQEYSDRFMSIIEAFSPSIQRYGIDEAYIDYTGTEHIHGVAMEAAKSISSRVKKELGLTVSIGIAPNKLLAKMGSDYKKPDAITEMSVEFFKQNMWGRPVNQLMYIGRKSQKRLEVMGINTIGALAEVPLLVLQKEFGIVGARMHEYANGIDYSIVETSTEREKGIGNSTTLPYDAKTMDEILAVLLWLAEQTAARLRKTGATTSTLCVSLKDNALKVKSRQAGLKSTDVTDEIYAASAAIARELWRGEPIRHVGLRLEKLSFEHMQQMRLDNEAYEKKRRLDSCVDKLRGKYGKACVVRGKVLGSEILDAGCYLSQTAAKQNEE